MVSPLLRLVAFPVDFFSSSSISQTMMWKKLGPFDVRKVPESKKIQKQESLLQSVKTK
jgi:hypothetical protein